MKNYLNGKPNLKKLPFFGAFLLMLFTMPSSYGIIPAKEYPVLAIGAEAPDFLLPGVDGKTYSLADFKESNILMVVFTCVHCPTAQAYEESLKKIVSDYKSKGVSVVAISPNDPTSIRLDELGYTDLSDGFEDMKIRADDMNFNFPYLYDGETSEVSMKYGPQATPHVFIFDKERKLKYSGRIDDGLGVPGKARTFDTRQALDQMLSGKKVEEPTTKTFGCSVKWPEKGNLVLNEKEGWAKEEVTLDEIDVPRVKTLLENKGDNYRLINVWATWCGPCVSEFPEFVTINRMYRLREFEMVTISMDDISRKTNVHNFLKKKQASSTNYILTGDNYEFIDELDKDWSGALPYTVLLAPGGKVIYSKQGMIDPLDLKKLIVDSLGRVFQLPAGYTPPKE